MSSRIPALTWQKSWQKSREASKGDFVLSFNAVVRPWKRSRSSSIAFGVSYSFSVSPSAIFTTITTAYAQMLRCQTGTRTRTQGGKGEHTSCSAFRPLISNQHSPWIRPSGNPNGFSQLGIKKKPKGGLSND